MVPSRPWISFGPVLRIGGAVGLRGGEHPGEGVLVEQSLDVIEKSTGVPGCGIGRKIVKEITVVRVIGRNPSVAIVGILPAERARSGHVFRERGRVKVGVVKARSADGFGAGQRVDGPQLRAVVIGHDEAADFLAFPELPVARDPIGIQIGGIEIAVPRQVALGTGAGEFGIPLLLKVQRSGFVLDRIVRDVEVA